MKTTVRAIAVASAMTAFSAFADEFDEIAAAVGDSGQSEAAQQEGEDNAPPGVQQQAASRYFQPLPSCREVSGVAEVLVPGEKEWKPAQKDLRYPLGTMFRTVGHGSALCVSFGLESYARIVGDASFLTKAQPLGEPSRTIGLVGGTLRLTLPKNLPEGLFSVTAPGFSAYNLAGVSRYVYRKTGDGDEAYVRCITQTLSVKGLHFDFVGMKAAQEVKIRSSQDQLFTGLYGSRGDVPVILDQGRILVKDFATGESKIEDKTLEWMLSPQTSVQIHRARPALGERLAVNVMTFDTRGDLVNRCSFAEKLFEVNTGEVGPVSKKEREELAKKAADLAAAQTAEAEATDIEAVPSPETPKQPDDAPAEPNYDDADLFM